MKNLSAAMLALAGVFAVVSASHADTRRTRDPGVNARQHNQRERIQQGVGSGELTRRETGKLVEEQRDVRQLERAYKSDGTLTGAERRDLQHEQNQASHDIYRQKHDEQERPPAAVRDPGVNERQANQTGRIVQGVKSGELTHDEAQELRTERSDIHDLEHTYKSDGTLTGEERQDLHQQLNQQSQEIYEEKHDDETRK
jgi:Skp family chaperone for outer membrane proteins